jgi:hypothetical protein
MGAGISGSQGNPFQGRPINAKQQLEFDIEQEREKI